MMSSLPVCSGGMDTTDDDGEAVEITPELLADDDDLREALAVVCKRTTDANPCDCISEKLLYLRATLEDGTFAIVTELVGALTRHHEEVVFTVVRDVLWSWAESDAANGIQSS